MPSETLSGQFVIIEPMKALDLKSANRGVCNGFTSALLQFALDGNLDNFIHLVDFIHKTLNLVNKIEAVIQDNDICLFFAPSVKEHKEEKEVPCLSQLTQEGSFTDAFNLLKMINVYQTPEEQGFKTLDSFETISKELAPNSIKEKGGIKQLYVDEMIFTPIEWCNYLEEVRSIMETEQSEEAPIVIRMELNCDMLVLPGNEIVQHAVGLIYNFKKRQWDLFDSNLLPSLPLVFNDLEESNSGLLDIDSLQLKKMLPGAIRNGRVIKVIKSLYFADADYLSAKIGFFTIGKNPRLEEIIDKLNSLKHSQLSYSAFNEFSIRRTPAGKGLIHLATQNGDLSKIKQLIKNNVSIINEEGADRTALNSALVYGSTEVPKTLLQPEYKCDIDLSDDEGRTAAYIAALNNRSELLELLANSGASLNLKAKNSYGPLHIAAQENSLDAVRVLLNFPDKISIDSTIDRGDTALCIAATKDNADMVELLASAGANPDARRVDGYAPLHIAAQEGATNAIQVLIKKCLVDIDDTTSDGSTALFIAVQNEVYDLIKYLLINGADVDKSNLKGCTPLHFSALLSGKSTFITRWLLKYQANPLKEDIIHHSAIYYALTRKRWKVALLLILNSDMNALNNEDKKLLIENQDQLLDSIKDLDYYEASEADTQKLTQNIKHFSLDKGISESLVFWGLFQGTVGQSNQVALTYSP